MLSKAIVGTLCATLRTSGPSCSPFMLIFSVKMTTLTLNLACHSMDRKSQENLGHQKLRKVGRVII